MDDGTGIPGRGNNMSKDCVLWGNLEQCDPARVGSENTGLHTQPGRGSACLQIRQVVQARLLDNDSFLSRDVVEPKYLIPIF